LLVTLEPRFAPVVAAGPLPMRRRADGFAALLSAIVAQQVSTASAAAIWGRVAEAGLNREAAWAGIGDDVLAACGLSRPKQRYGTGAGGGGDRLGRAAGGGDGGGDRNAGGVAGGGALDGGDLREIRARPRRCLRGGRPGVAGKRAAAFRSADARPSEAELRAMAAAWSPVRAVAARALWVYYRWDTDREGVL
jgi:DNA-3-methyladenine glycosylase II